MAAYPTATQLTAFSSSVYNLSRDFADGSKGPPMLLDGSWRTYKTVKMRYQDLCTEFDLERFRSGREVYPTNRGDDLAARQASWRQCHEKILGTTRRLMPDTRAQLYRSKQGDDLTFAINPDEGLGFCIWRELDLECGGGDVELQTVQFEELEHMAQQPDTANPYPFAEKFVVAARQVQPVVDDRHIKSMLLKRLPPALAEWADRQRSRRSERAGHTDASCCTDEVLAWLKIKSQQGGLPWMRQTNAAPSASLQSLQDQVTDGLQQQQGPYVPPHLASGYSHA
jgi:hypothetical protein